MLKKLSYCTAILFAVLSIVSCKTVQQANLKEIKPFVGIWDVTNHPGSKIVFKSDGSFYNLVKENGTKIVTHSGSFKVLSNNFYVLDITYARADATYQLAGKQYINSFELSENNQKMKMTGVVDARNGGSKLEWTDQLVKVNAID
ncbi:hypothetical protein EZ449_18510 [Pedobacter frigidisoli]|uniref:DUF4488 domain-containing protein n=1 Tax=Pedobacter frigidisoli TaxID=2530455 RepID=A0A4R0NNA3_9SPHI|nr:hypothetical protein [Pedobacter frigidisoli]TCD02351.1 hypothetical protein EZ449_18510 [Pedobacter frigidisoli]